MRSNYLTLATVSALLTLAFFKIEPKNHPTFYGGEGFDEDQDARRQWELQMLADPATGRIPDHIREKELAFAATLPSDYAAYKNGLEGNPWQNIGPWNVGGRTRAVAFDASNENTIIAGGVSGGIWKSTDGGQSWERKTTPKQMPGITCITQNNLRPNIWYAGTGEGSGASPSGGGAYYLGNGLYRSSDGGETWTVLAKTASNSPQVFDKNFDICWNVATSHNDTADMVFVATYGSIYKVTNAGNKVLQVRGGTSLANQYSYYTDVAVTKTGIVYAALSSEGGNPGLWRSDDTGKTWTNITPANFPKVYERVVIGLYAGDESQVYFLAHTESEGLRSVDFRGAVEYNSLWKYKYISGNGSGAGAVWHDLSLNLPAKGGQFGSFITQGGYDLYVRVKPDDSNMVYLGVNNLWRGSTGFNDTNHTDWIGGYGVNTSYPDFHVYPNHHPDNHNMIFYPSNPKKMISACDGGLFRCDDNTSSNLSWTPLNNGYLTTQFYTIAMDHLPTGKTFIGGLQDNGTYWTNDPSNPKFNWVMPFNGDGSYCSVPDGAKDLYVSKQQGKVYHIQIDSTGNATKFVRIDPGGAPNNKYGFINPFVCDPAKQSRMYMPNGDRIYRNDDVNQIPLKAALDSDETTLGWQVMDSTIDSFQTISAISISKNPGDIVYYGTSKGELYKIANASTGQPGKIDITGSNFPANAYISCICPHPDDADKIIVVFSNYNVRSIFYTVNGGKTWTNVSGNLEQFVDGTGNGPSCRWASIMPMQGYNAYFMATSTGLYTTDSLQGTNTRWVLQGAENIGNYPCTMIDYRLSDGLVLVATHGSGVYAAIIKDRFQVLGTGQIKQDLFSIQTFPNPFTDVLNIQFRNHKKQTVYIEMLDVQGRKVKEIYNGRMEEGSRQLTANRDGLAQGIYYLRVQAGEMAETKMVMAE